MSIKKIASFLRQAKTTFDKEAHDRSWGLTVSDYRPNFQFDLYKNISGIGKRGTTIDITSYRIWDHITRTAWGSTLLHRINASMTYDAVTKAIEDIIQEAIQESKQFNAEKGFATYPPSTHTEKGISERLPEPSWADIYKDRRDGNLTVDFNKPRITITGQSESKEADKGRMQTYIVIKWNYAKKVNELLSDILKTQSLAGAKKVLDSNGISNNWIHNIDPMWA